MFLSCSSKWLPPPLRKIGHGKNVNESRAASKKLDRKSAVSFFYFYLLMPLPMSMQLSLKEQ